MLCFLFYIMLRQKFIQRVRGKRKMTGRSHEKYQKLRGDHL